MAEQWNWLQKTEVTSYLCEFRTPATLRSNADWLGLQSIYSFAKISEDIQSDSRSHFPGVRYITQKPLISH